MSLIRVVSSFWTGNFVAELRSCDASMSRFCSSCWMQTIIKISFSFFVPPAALIAIRHVHHATVHRSHNAFTASRIDFHSRENASINVRTDTMATRRGKSACPVRPAVPPVAVINVWLVSQIGSKTRRTNVSPKAVTIATNVSRILRVPFWCLSEIWTHRVHYFVLSMYPVSRVVVRTS